MNAKIFPVTDPIRAEADEIINALNNRSEEIKGEIKITKHR